ncbi:MAG: 6,7-dimethyl-8-ribityllumazine synthase [Stagnimonas sp.]|nr:6,7-dimethyl-8-ribityllumazine synthase [Stagnimonas sp.]
MKSGYAAPKKPSKKEFKDTRIALLATRWNVEVVEALLAGAEACLEDWGVAEQNVEVFYAPGAYELPLAASAILASGRFDGVVALGAVIRGDTPHFDFVAGECARGLMDVQLAICRPVGFGVLTVNTPEQALERCKPDKTNKGYECAAAVLEMLRLTRAVIGSPYAAESAEAA